MARPTAPAHKNHLYHAAMAQLHRWYLPYENPAIGLEQQLDILSPDVHLKSALGEARGHDQYAERFQQIPSDWQNAHIVNSTQFDVREDGTLRLNADITYHNVGILPDNKVKTAELTYETTLVPADALLPRFSQIKITQKSESTTDTFTPVYAENRFQSLLHYWFAIVKSPEARTQLASEILAPEFTLNFASRVLTDLADVDNWIAETGRQLIPSTHTASIKDHQDLKSDGHAFTVDFVWDNIQTDKGSVSGETRHIWTIADAVPERFARIKQVDVEILKPFAPQ